MIGSVLFALALTEIVLIYFKPVSIRTITNQHDASSLNPILGYELQKRSILFPLPRCLTTPTGSIIQNRSEAVREAAPDIGSLWIDTVEGKG